MYILYHFEDFFVILSVYASVDNHAMMVYFSNAVLDYL